LNDFAAGTINFSPWIAGLSLAGSPALLTRVVALEGALSLLLAMQFTPSIKNPLGEKSDKKVRQLYAL